MTPRRTTFISYRPRTILNKHKRADHWFWTRYSAYPYVGCQHGCEFCYCREQKYSPYDDPNDFAHVIKVKENAPELLRRALKHAPLDPIFTGDYQPLERKFEMSRRMLEVCLETGFPVFVLERNTGILRDLDLLKEIHARARTVVAFSIISTPDSRDYERVCQMEHLAPPAAKRFAIMEKIAAAGIPVGTCMMPILPGLCDSQENIQNVARWTAEHGGSFMLAGGLTLSDQQKDFFFGVLRERFPDLLALYQRLYPPQSYGPADGSGRTLALRAHEACTRFGIRDRIPRPIVPGEKRALNKRIVELLAEKLHTLELNGEAEYRLWAYRKAAWAIEDMQEELGLLYRAMGLKGLQSIPEVGQDVAAEIAAWIDAGPSGN